MHIENPGKCHALFTFLFNFSVLIIEGVDCVSRKRNVMYQWVYGSVGLSVTPLISRRGCGEGGMGRERGCGEGRRGMGCVERGEGEVDVERREGEGYVERREGEGDVEKGEWVWRVGKGKGGIESGKG